MNCESGTTVSVWMDTAQRSVYVSLNESITCDVCIIGAGITGLSCGYLLTKEGKTVVILDDGLIAGGETERTTAHITNVLDDRYFEIERIHGLDKTRLVKESETAAIDKIESIVKSEQIDCDFTRLDGYLFLAPDSATDVLSRELDTLKRIGYIDVELMKRLPQLKNAPPALRFPNQAQFHVWKYLNGLCQAVTADGGKIFQETHVESIEDGALVKVKTTAGNIVTAKSVIVATNSPVTDFVAVHTKQAAYRTFVIGIRVKKGSVPAGLYWDTAEPYHYVRLQDINGAPDSEILIVGGEDHKTGQENDADKRFDRLEEWARQVLQVSGEVKYRWSGQVYEPVDGLSFIGKDPEHGANVYIATGDGGTGMTHATMAALILSDLIMGRQNPWAEVYQPTRKSVGSLTEFLKENVNAVSQYAQNVLPAEITLEGIANDEGAVMSRGLEKIAVFRDKNGQLQEYSALCPHLKGVLNWNSCEKSWDCPLHGSRFTATGEVIDGPANSNMGDTK